MNYSCELINQPVQPVLSVRTRSSLDNLSQVIGKVYGDIMQYLSEIGETASSVPFVAYYNMDMADLDIEIGFPVSKTLPGKGTIQSNEIPAGLYATCLHIGPYTAVVDAYNALNQFIQEEGHTALGHCYEFYLNDPASVPESELQTKILFPV